MCAPEYFFHDDLPPLWQREERRLGAAYLQIGDGLEKAHLPTAGEEDWWLGNQMQPYSPTESFSSEPIDGPANRLILRADLGRVFEEGHFCFVPKVRERRGGDGEVPKLVFHVFNSTPSG